MAGTITHQWTGTVLTITSDSGTSSCDLKGAKGDDGARGAQGAPGSSVAEDSQMLGGVAAAQYALKNNVPAHNFLDNSNFRNPVNQRGKNTYSNEGNEYTIDRWKTQYGTNISIENGYINIFGDWQLYQIIQNPKDGIYTFAARIRVNSVGQFTPNIYVSDGSNSHETLLDANIGEWKTYILQYDLSSTTAETISFSLSSRGGNTTASISVEWAAMYKGAYDASTLPPYVPKGYGEELAECQRYFERLGTSSSAVLGTTVFAKTGAKSVIISIQYSPKRIETPTITFSNASEYRLLQRDAVNASTYGATPVSSIDEISSQSPFACFRVNFTSALDLDSWLTLQRQDGSNGAYIDVNADL